MRFDDSLKTVLAADASTAFGAQATFRQIADLVARGRVPADEAALERLRLIRNEVPVGVRAAVARALAMTRPPVALVLLFAQDEPAVASAMLRGAQLDDQDWLALLPQLGPAGWAVLRGRRDLGAAVTRGLESFGSTDFTIGFVPRPSADQPTAPAVGAGPFAAIGTITAALPVVETLRRAEDAPQPRGDGGFDIAELVDRIATFQRERGEPDTADAPGVIDRFRFETGADGVIRWTDAPARGALVGVSIAAAATVLFRKRAAFEDVSLALPSAGPMSGDWRLSAVPLFDEVNGSFSGYRGSARRERASPAPTIGTASSEGLRRLVHELRTPTNAIAGFSELIEAQLLGPVAPTYCERATMIRALAGDLVAAIDDLDLAARIDGAALELRPGLLQLAPLLGRLVGQFQARAAEHGFALSLAPMDASLELIGDDRMIERILARLIGLAVTAAQAGEAIGISASGSARTVSIMVDRPRLLSGMADQALLDLDADQHPTRPGASLLGTGFGLRLIGKLAAELGGALSIERTRLIVTLPAAGAAMEQAAAR